MLERESEVAFRAGQKAQENSKGFKENLGFNSLVKVVHILYNFTS